MPPLKIATISPAWNDGTLLVQYLRHYVPQVDRVFLLDNESDDGSMDSIPKEFRDRVEVRSYGTGGFFDDQAKLDAVIRMKSECCGKYDFVFLLDSDEFIVPMVGETAPLREVVAAKATHPIHWTSGWTMVVRPEDSPYDPEVPLTAQRRWGFPDMEYTKPVLVRPEFPANYIAGMHSVNQSDPVGGSFLRLLHYRVFDEEAYVRRSLARTRRMSKNNITLGWGVQYIHRDERFYRDYFRQLLSNPFEKIL